MSTFKELVKISHVDEAGHYMSVDVGLALTKCNVCHIEDVPCLLVDSSDGEYGSGSVCKECVINLFAQGEEKHEGSKILYGDL